MKKTYDKEFGAVRTTFDQHSLFFSFFFFKSGEIKAPTNGLSDYFICIVAQ